MRIIRVNIFYPADPAGVIPGGIDTFIRGLIGAAPDDIRFRLYGVTTDQKSRPVAKWTRCELAQHAFDFFPVLEIKDPARRSRVPLSLRYSCALAARIDHRDADVYDFHRVEPALLFLASRTPCNIFVHQNMNILKDKNSDIFWKHAPWLFYAIENIVLGKCESIFCVREDAIESYRQRFSRKAKFIRFVPTWVDPSIFKEFPRAEKVQARARLRQRYGFKSTDRVLVFVGRLDSQKDPLLLIDAFSTLVAANDGIRLLIVGDGVMRKEIEQGITERGLEGKAVLTGLMRQNDIAVVLNAADLFVLSSAYEGMPICVLEALGCGLPVVASAVGEVPRIIRNGINGILCPDRTRDVFASAIKRAIDILPDMQGKNCTRVAERFVPETVLAPIFENYRRLAKIGKAEVGD